MNIVIYKMVNSNLLSVLTAVFGVEAEAGSGEDLHDSNELVVVVLVPIVA